MKQYLRLGAVMFGMTVAKATMRCARSIRNEYRDIEALRAAQQYDQSASGLKAFWLGLVSGCRAAPRAYFAPLRGIARAVKGDAPKGGAV
jgi:hypothetical protein